MGTFGGFPGSGGNTVILSHKHHGAILERTNFVGLTDGRTIRRTDGKLIYQVGLQGPHIPYHDIQILILVTVSLKCGYCEAHYNETAILWLTFEPSLWKPLTVPNSFQ